MWFCSHSTRHFQQRQSLQFRSYRGPLLPFAMASTKEQNRLLTQMEVLVSNRLEAFESRMVDAQRVLSETQLAKLQQNFGANDTYQFRRKGNEEQYKCNRQVLNSLREADAHLGELTTPDAPPAFSAARRKLVEGMNAILHRQKMIKLADSSELGWRVVQEYEAHPLAEDSDDEKKIYRAQIHADRKVRKERKAKAHRFSPSQPSVAIAAIASVVNIENEIVSPVGKLKAKIDFWRDRGANAFLIDVLSNGYKLPFKTIPPSARLKNNRSAFDNPEIVTREIEKLVEKGCVREVDHCPTVVNPLTVAFNKFEQAASSSRL